MATNRPELPDNQLIQNSFRSNPTPALIYLAIVAAVAALLWGGMSEYLDYKQQKQQENPFLQVTNRDFSLFLWQFPEYMRANVSSKANYLPGFQYSEKISIEPGEADHYVSGPPEVLFLYHAWKRLIGDDWSPRAIYSGEFQKFLDYCPEWLPKNWSNAPVDYKSLIDNLDKEDPQALVKRLPIDVQRAFIGWKNFFQEGDLINQVKPTYKDMADFVLRFPDYARNDWRNIVMKGKPDYLKSLFLNKFDPKDFVPESELAGFLKVAFFNYEKSI